MDFELNQDQKMLQSSVRTFVEKEVKPLAIQIDETHAIPPELVKQISDMGMLGVYIPEEYGGAGMDMLSYAIVVEEVSRRIPRWRATRSTGSATRNRKRNSCRCSPPVNGSAACS
jgi:alkylation response protein AidB-like acyl-CoA dehydrogenase